MHISKTAHDFLATFIGVVLSVAAIAALCLIACACQSRKNVAAEDAIDFLNDHKPISAHVEFQKASDAVQTVKVEAAKTDGALKAAEKAPTLPETKAEVAKAKVSNDAVRKAAEAATPAIQGAAKAGEGCLKENAALKDAPAAAARQAEAQGLSAGIKFSVFLGGLAVLAGIACFLPWTAPFVPFVVPEVLGAAAVLVFVIVGALAKYLDTAFHIAAFVAVCGLLYACVRFAIRHHLGHYLDAAKAHLVASIGGAWAVAKTWIQTACPIVKKDAAEAKNWTVAELQKAKDEAVLLKGKAAVIEAKVADAVKKI